MSEIAIVTGGSRGIGRGVAEALLAEGWKVWICSRSQESVDKAVHEMGGQIQGRPVDVRDQGQVEGFTKEVLDAEGRIDCLVNNAAWIEQWHDLEHAPRAEWDRSYQISLMGAVNFTKLVLPHMTPHRAGSIINISSIQGIVGARQSPAYTAMKHALVGLTRNIAYDYGTQSIRCNAICPGAIRTRISPPDGSELHPRQVSKTMLGRTGEPAEVAKAAVFLASDDASYITGAVIPVDGGWTAM